MLVVIVLALIVFVCIKTYTEVHESDGKPPEPTSSAPLTIGSLMNARVLPSWSEKDLIALKNGSYEEPISDSGTPSNVYMSADLDTATSSYAVTDLDADGAQDIVAVIADTSGGTGYFFALEAFINDGGAPRYAGRLSLGDRIKVNTITADKNIITVDIITQGPGEGLCCGTLRQVKTYEFDAGKGFKEI